MSDLKTSPKIDEVPKREPDLAMNSKEKVEDTAVGDLEKGGQRAPASTKIFGISVSPMVREIIAMMVALLLPVFLETLDYTGTCTFHPLKRLPHPHIHLPVVATAQPHIASAFNALDLQRYVNSSL